jgi:hypothetical protein
VTKIVGNGAKAHRNGLDNIQRVESGPAPLWVAPELRRRAG